MFITIDGPDGVGKTTIANKLADRINEKLGEVRAVYTSEPTSSELGKKIRRILCSSSLEEQSHLTEYFIEDRKYHIEEINTMLSNHKIVICDRYKYSTVIYQSIQGEEIDNLVGLNYDFKKPDYAFILNVTNVETLISHISQREKARDLFETKTVLEKIIVGYNNMKTYFPEENIIFIDAERRMDSVLEDMVSKLKFI